MGRNKKIGLDYFPFDIDFFQDLKIRKLIKYQGGKAVTVYALLLCNIYKQGYYMRWDEELPFIVSEQTGFEEAYIREVIKCCLVVGLFSKDLYESDKILTSKGIQERYQKICDLCRRNNEILEFNIISSEEKPLSSEESAQRKGKKKKENSLSREKEIYGDNVEISLDECKEQLESDRSWIEIVTMNTRSNGHGDFTLQSTLDYIRMFFTKLQNEGLKAKNVADAKAHFARWLQIQLKHEENSRTDKQQANDYAFKQYLAEREKIEKGVYDQVPDIFAD